MATSEIRVVDVYAYRHQAGADPEFLLLRRAEGVIYAGEWRMIGGKIKTGEAAWQTALREVQEETSQAPQCLWTIPSVNAFYEWSADRINLIPTFAAALSADPILNHEHDAFQWCPLTEALTYVTWPEHQRLLRLTDHLLRTNTVSPTLYISLDKIMT